MATVVQRRLNIVQNSRHVLVVGAGFAGAVYARELAEAGFNVQVIDKRDHVGGNAYDYLSDDGVRVHRYGPHLFHTNSKPIVDWLWRFGKWQNYEHKVRALLADGRFVPLPVNRDTIQAVFGCKLASSEDTRAFLEKIGEPIPEPRNAKEYLYSRIGKILTDTFFSPYTQKMWGLDLDQMHASVVRRLPLRLDTEERYFPDDNYQYLPQDGYGALFSNILDHQRILVSLNTEFDLNMELSFRHVFNSMPIDEYFDFRFGELPYRSIRFHSRVQPGKVAPWAVVNFTDNGPFTRETTWNALSNNSRTETNNLTITAEEPCDYRFNNMERYYPVRTADNRFQSLYARYKLLSASECPQVTFIGRCGMYQYLDMDQVINQSLSSAKTWLQRNPYSSLA